MPTRGRKELGKWGYPPGRWGAQRSYKNLTPWNPIQWAVHWNGGPVNVGDFDDEIAYVRKVEQWHLNKGWYGDAYNWHIGVASAHAIRVRGEGRSGAQWNDMNPITRAIQFTMGSGEPLPSLYPRRTFATMFLLDPLPVKPHWLVNQEGNDPPTSCPGPDLTAWIDRQGWAEDFGLVGVGAKSRRVRAIKVRLIDLGYRQFIGPRPDYFTKHLAKQVRAYQTDLGLIVDGIVGPQTYRALADLPIPDEQAWGDEIAGETPL